MQMEIIKKKEKKKMDIVVISLFDGLSGARLALEGLKDINVLRYYSSDIDEFAIKVADSNYPQDTLYRLGDITKIDTDKLKLEISNDFGDIPILLIGGSPCQGFSIAGHMRGSATKEGLDVVSLDQYLNLKSNGFEFDGQSFLFWEYQRIKRDINPIFWVLENVRVTKKWLPMFNETMGVDGKLINSNVFSAQDRPRFYWASTILEDPTEISTLTIKDILEDLPIEQPLSPYMSKKFNGVSRLKKGIFNFTERPKGVTQTTGSGHGCKYIIKGNPDNAIAKRKLTPLEQERLQTIPDNYTAYVPTGKREHMIGNGFTIKVIEFVLNQVLKNK